MGLSTFDRENLGHIIDGHGSWFTADLLRLIAKADHVNRERLRLAFPAEVEAFERWRATGGCTDHEPLTKGDPRP